MVCVRCRHEMPDEANYCPSCGASQRASASMPLSARRLTRSPGRGKIAGVCAGLAEYFDVDVTLVRTLWLIFSIVPGVVVGGILAYVLAWLVMPEGHGTSDVDKGRHRLMRSTTDRKIAGVCGGLAEYFGVDSTPLRVLWLVLSILPGALVGGAIAYLAAWLVIPKASLGALAPTPSQPVPGT